MASFRKFVLQAHLWIGLTACLLLFVLATTGAILVFEFPLDNLLNRSVAYVTPRSQRLPLDKLAENVRTQFPTCRIIAVDLSMRSPSPDLSFIFLVFDGKNRVQVFVDEYNGRIQGSRLAGTNFTQKVYELHTRLLGPPSWTLITALVSLLLVALAISGIYLWWQRRIVWPNFSANARKLNFQLHNTIGLYASVVIFMFAFTAVTMHWNDQLLALTDFVSRSHREYRQRRPNSGPEPAGSQQISLERIDVIATQTMPGARVAQILLPNRATDYFRVSMKFPDDKTPAGRSLVEIDQFSGQVLLAHSEREAPWSARYLQQWNREIHTGDVFGWSSKIVVLLATAALAFLAISGPLIWILKKAHLFRAKFFASVMTTRQVG